MGKRGPESFMKRQKELKRMQKAAEKMARRYGRRKRRREEAEGGGGAVSPDEGQGVPPFDAAT